MEALKTLLTSFLEHYMLMSVPRPIRYYQALKMMATPRETIRPPNQGHFSTRRLGTTMTIRHIQWMLVQQILMFRSQMAPCSNVRERLLNLPSYHKAFLTWAPTIFKRRRSMGLLHAVNLLYYPRVSSI